MKKKKQTPKEIRDKKISQALGRIRRLEKTFEQDVIASACNRYSILVRDKKSALAKKEDLEKQLAELKGKI